MAFSVSQGRLGPSATLAGSASYSVSSAYIRRKKNKEDGALSFRMLGAPARVLLGLKDAPIVGVGGNSVTESYLDTCRSICSSKAHGPPASVKTSSAESVIKRHKPGKSWSTIVSESRVSSEAKTIGFPDHAVRRRRPDQSDPKSSASSVAEVPSVSSLAYSTTISSTQSAIKDLQQENKNLRKDMEKMAANRAKRTPN